VFFLDNERIYDLVVTKTEKKWFVVDALREKGGTRTIMPVPCEALDGDGKH
jgi:hypothetical protein